MKFGRGDFRGANTRSRRTFGFIRNRSFFVFEFSQFTRFALMLLLLMVIMDSRIDAAEVIVNFSDHHQRITGFGASGGNDSASNFPKLTPVNQQALCDLLFDVEKGIGLSMVRNELYAKIEPSPGVWDWAKDNDQIWLMNEAKKRGVDYFWSACWSMPAWMKDNNKLIDGGHLLPEHYPDYVNFLVQYVKEYKARFGLEIKAISLTNEPNVSTFYQSCVWSGEQLRDFIKTSLGPAFAREGIKALIVMPESADWKSLAGLADPAMNDPDARQYIQIIAGHQYDQTYLSQKEPKFPPATPLTAYPPAKLFKKEIWETEVSFIGGKPDPGIKWGLGTALIIHNAMAGAEVNSWHWWVFLGSWGDNEGLADLAGDGYIVNKRLYCMGNYSKFIRPGYQMIGVTHDPDADIYVTAFEEPATGKFAVVAINKSSADKTITLKFQDLEVPAVTPWVTSASLNLAQQPALAVKGNQCAAALLSQSVTSLVGQGKPPKSQSTEPSIEKQTR